MKIPCNTNNVGYKLICTTCLDRGHTKVYEGETGRSGRVRRNEHWNDFVKEKPTGVLYKHKQNEHQLEEMNIRMEITKPFRDPLTRQANEGVRIENRAKNELLNSKSEFNHPPTARIVVEKKNQLVGL